MNNYNKDLEWRYATKQFDATKSISDEDLEFLKDAMQLTASSFGLQPYEILIIKDKAIREKLKAVSWNQSQITDASVLVVIANKVNFGEELVDEFVANIAKTRDMPKDDLADYSNVMKNSISSRNPEELAFWTAKQSYIVLGNLLSAAASLKIDTCPMEGFDPEKYNEILGLTEQGLNAAVIAPIGYREAEDPYQHYKKVRKPKSKLFQTI